LAVGLRPAKDNPFFPEMVGASEKANAPTAPGKMFRAARGKKDKGENHVRHQEAA
jgi:hypothetical protein